MGQWIEFARGPLFVFAFLVMVVGLFRLVILQLFLIFSRKGARLHKVGWRKMVVEAAGWAVPVRHFVIGTRLLSAMSYLAHIGIVIVPVLLADHVARWEQLLKLPLPRIGYPLADFLTLLTVAGLAGLLCLRLLSRRQRALSQISDYILLVLVLLPFASGFLAMHPRYNPLPWDFMMLLHLLSGNLLLALVPFTKLSHVVLFFFDRVSGLHWQLRPGAGHAVAQALYGKEARV